MKSLVLVVDDEPRMVDLIGIALEGQNFDWVGATTADEAIDVLLNRQVDLMISDVLMPGESGIELCRRIRQFSQLPIILVTALGATDERIRGLEAGADDYMAKPFSPRELALRVQAVLRRRGIPASDPRESAVRQIGDIALDPGSLQVHVAGERVRLSRGEFRLLWYLSERVGQTVAWDELFAAMGDDVEPFGGREAVRAAVYRLRVKLGDPSGQPKHLLTDRGRGYRLVNPKDITGL